MHAFLDAPLLNTGICLVDTAGVDSLNPEVGARTVAFLPEVSLGLFMIHTSPTLTESERQFLDRVWHKGQNLIFVQNRWGQDDDVVEEARLDNLDKLRRVARAHGDQSEPELIIVDVATAATAAVDGDESGCHSSGLTALSAAIHRRVAGGAARAHLVTNGGSLHRTLLAAERAATGRLAELQNHERETDAEFDERLGRAAAEVESAEAAWTAAKATFTAARDQVIQDFESQLRQALGEARTRLLRHAEHGGMNPSSLSAALQAEIDESCRGPIAALERAWRQHVAELVTAAASVQATLPNLGGGPLPELSGWQTLGTVGAGVKGFGTFAIGVAGFAAAGAAIGALIAGEGTAAAVAAAGAAVPGIGWVVAVGALVIGAAAAASARSAIRREMVAAIGTTLKQAENRLLEHVRGVISAQASTILVELRCETEGAIAEARGLTEDIRADRQRSASDREALRASLNRHHAAVAQATATVQTVLEESQ
ncbi:hypothetical protein LBMAG42_56140 [Deltaproteobacteria bacterium]|nr:hypothetical protein LBMAG42_56140 [Deltaproteobacteria bacterium]